MAIEGGDPIVTFTGVTMNHEGEENLEEEGESSSTSATNLVVHTTKSNNALEVDQTEAQSTTLVLPSGREMVEVSTPHASQQRLGTNISPHASSLHLFASAAVEGAHGECYGNMSIDQDHMMSFIPPNHHDPSSQILFPSQGAGIGSLMSEDNAYNNGSQQAGLTAENTFWALNNGYQFGSTTTNLVSDHHQFSLTPIPSAIHLSNAQAAMGGGISQYPPGFMQTQTPDQWYPLSKINIQQHPSSTPFGSEEIQFQGLMNQGPSNGIFYSTGHPTIQFPQTTRLNLQDGMPSSSNLHGLSRNWISEGHGLSNSTTPPTSRSLPPSRNAVYDPSYESMGLPVDPHLRMFLARRDSTGDEMK